VKENFNLYTRGSTKLPPKFTSRNLSSYPGGDEVFRRPDRPWGPPSLLYNGYWVFPGVKCGRGVLLTTHPFLVPRSWKSRAINLPTLWATPGL